MQSSSARRKFAFAAPPPEPSGKPAIPVRRHTFYNGPVCLGPPDGAKTFEDQGLEESNVIHGPVSIRGPVKLDGAAAISFFRELYCDRGESKDVASGARSLDINQPKGLAELWERVSEFFNSDGNREEPPKPTEWAVRENELREGLEWNPLVQDGVSLPPNSPVVSQVPIEWQVSSSNREEDFGARRVSSSNWVEDEKERCLFSGEEDVEVVSRKIYRGRVAFVSPDPIGTRTLCARRGESGKAVILAVKNAQLSRGGTVPDFLDFEIAFDRVQSNEPVQFFLARNPPGKLVPVRTNSRMLEWFAP